jgi:hypothetical protein
MASTQYTRLLSLAFWKSSLGRWRERRAGRARPIIDQDGLAEFVRTRAAHVAQTALYGYLRARAGTRFPELFSNDAFVSSINIAKWHVWLACVSDLAVYAGGLVRRDAHAHGPQIAGLMQGVVELLLRENGAPGEAGGDYEAHASHVRSRIAMCDWGAVPDDETAFSQSPDALVQWAPIVDELKQLDEEIVRNSVRFRWREVREELRRLIDAETLVASAATARRADDTPARDA